MLLNTVHTVNFQLQRWQGSCIMFNSGEAWKCLSLDQMKRKNVSVAMYARNQSCVRTCSPSIHMYAKYTNCWNLTHKYIMTAHCSYLYYSEWKTFWYEKFTLQRFTMPFSKLLTCKCIYLVIRFSMTKSLLWNKKNTYWDSVNEQNTHHTHTHRQLYKRLISVSDRGWYRLFLTLVYWGTLISECPILK